MKEMGYLNGFFKPLDEITISPLDRGFLFGDGVYEVTRVHKGRPFALSYHEDRLYRSCREADIPIRIPPDELSELHEILIEQSGITDGSIYLQITRGAGPRAHSYKDFQGEPTVFMAIQPYAERSAKAKYGVKAIACEDLRWDRCDIKTINLLPNIMTVTKADKKGAYSALLYKGDILTEGSSNNVFVVKDGILYTHPADHSILKGITRQLVVTRLAPLCSVTLIEKACHKSFVEEADELFFTDTLGGIIPILAVDKKPVGQGEIGRVTKRIQDAYEHLLAEGLP